MMHDIRHIRSVERVARRAGIASALLRAGAIERGAFRAMMACGRAGSLAALAWLTLLLRPVSLIRLALEPFRRRTLNSAAWRGSSREEAG